MKKVLCAIFAILMVFSLVGCANSNTEAALAKRLSKNTNNLLNAIYNLEEITDEDINIPEFSGNISSFQTINSNTKANKVSKIKQLFKRSELVNIKNVENRNNLPRLTEVEPQSINSSIYQPKYVSSSTTNNTLDLFKSKIENLYNVCSDCNYINSECNRCQEELKTSISECKFLCSKLDTGEIKLTEEQLNQCNIYSKQINSCVEKIKDCRGDCNNYLQTLRALKGYFGSNSDTLSINYLNLLGCLENRLSCYKEAFECVNNCNNLLKSCYANNSANKTPYQLEKENVLNNEEINNLRNNNTETVVDNKQSNNQNQTNNIQQNNQSTNNKNITNNANNGYNSNNGYYNNGYYFNGYYNNGMNPYNQTPNNVNTYGPINKNIDTYKNIDTNNNTYNSNFPNSTTVNEENKTIINKENNHNIKEMLDKKDIVENTKTKEESVLNKDKESNINSENKIDLIKTDNQTINNNQTEDINNNLLTNQNDKVEKDKEDIVTDKSNNIGEEENETNSSLKEEKFVSSEIKTYSKENKKIENFEENKTTNTKQVANM